MGYPVNEEENRESDSHAQKLREKPTSMARYLRSAPTSHGLHAWPPTGFGVKSTPGEMKRS
jgi:hypothetical protein